MKQDVQRIIQLASGIVDQWVPWKMYYEHVPGLSLGIVYKGKLVYARGFGFANVKKRKRATPRTYYRVASISKMFTSIAVSQLVEKKKCRLDDPIVQYLPWLRTNIKKTSDIGHITLRQILSHTSGIFRDGAKSHWENDAFPTKEDIQKEWSAHALVFEELTQFKYSNYGYALLGLVIEAVTGMPFNEYVEKYILQPLHMRHTFLDLIPRLQEFLAVGYSRPIPDQKRESYTPTPMHAYAPAAGCISTVEDLATFISAFSLARKNNVKQNNTLIGRRLIKEMFRPVWRTRLNASYGLGVDIFPVEDRTVIGHGGGCSGYISQVIFDPQLEIGVVSLSNTTQQTAVTSARGVMEILYQLLDHPEWWQGKPVTHAQHFSGNYRLRWCDMIIAPLGRQLIACYPGVDSPLKEGFFLSPKGRDRFVISGENVFDYIGEEARFVRTAQKHATRLYWGTEPMEYVPNSRL